MRKAGGWVIAWGIVLVLTGIFAIVAPGAAALATVLVLAWLFVVAGVAQLVYAFQQRGHDGFGWKLISALATLALGLAMLVFPAASIASVALLIGGFIFASGISTVLLAFRLKPKAGWGWVLFDGLLSIVIAILIAPDGRRARSSSSASSWASASLPAASGASFRAARCARRPDALMGAGGDVDASPSAKRWSSSTRRAAPTAEPTSRASAGTRRTR
jgi:uncharacterized membrane protein HdeD (DUF308 family)